MKHILFMVFNLLVIARINSQSPSESDLYKIIHNSKTYKSYILLKNQDSLFSKNNTMKETYNQRLGVLNSFWGNYYDALKCFNLNYNSSESQFDITKFNTYFPTSAYKVIDSLSQINRIIIINESHHVPQHRITTMELLPILFKNGYRYLALETLSHLDSNLHKRGYPLNKLTGYYTDEPCFGDMVRTALKIGFKLVAYEDTLLSNDRHKMQAYNLVKNVFSQDPNAKLFIHSGNMNGLDIEIGKDHGLMGYHLKKLTGIDPLLINQVYFSENYTQKNEQIDYQYSMSHYNIKEPTVFMNNENHIWHNMYEGDIALFLPRSEYVHNRPTWLNFNNKKQYYFLDKSFSKIPTPFLVQFFLKNETYNSVPIDQIEITGSTLSKALLLYKGSYLMRITDKEGNVIVSRKIKIK